MKKELTPEQQKRRKKILTERIIIGVLALIVIGLLVFFLWDVFIPFIKLQAAQDTEGAKELLKEKGFLGYATVSLVEALQMVVIFIPAEFIQLTSGMSYPWWLALVLCDIGVIIGSSIIYMLINLFRFEGDILNKTSQLEKYAKRSKTNSTMLLMYILFIMPIIPFGAICYYGSSKKIPYHKYLLTCATGVIPSIFTSIIMGTAVKEFIARSLPIWALVLIIIGAAAILFGLLAFVLTKFVFKKNIGTPDSWTYGFVTKLMSLFTFFTVKYKFLGREKLEGLPDQHMVLCNHHTWFDFMAVYKLTKNYRYATMLNSFYYRLPLVGRWIKTAGTIGKKMFYNDYKAVKTMMHFLKKDGYPVAMFPEARLSTDGDRSLINPSTAKLVKIAGVPLVLVQARYGYFVKPKWRKKHFRGKYEVEVMRVLSTEEIASMSEEEIMKVIGENLYFNEFDLPNIKVTNRNRALGLEKILYRCPNCGGHYTNYSKGNFLICNNCNKTYEIGTDYQFIDGDIKNIHDYYQIIKDTERKNLDHINFELDVEVKIFVDNVKKPQMDAGKFYFDNEKVKFVSSIRDFSFEIACKDLEGIPYSVNEEFEMYYENNLYYFYPLNIDRAVCTELALVFELLKEREANGKQNQ